MDTSVLPSIWGISRPHNDHVGVSSFVLNGLVSLPDNLVQKKAGSSDLGSSFHDIAPGLAKAVNSVVN